MNLMVYVYIIKTVIITPLQNKLILGEMLCFQNLMQILSKLIIFSFTKMKNDLNYMCKCPVDNK